jgi:hypothetical protein
MPLCWSAIAVTRDDDHDTLTSQRGTLSFAPAWYSAERCASYRLAGEPSRTVRTSGKVTWRDDFRQSIAMLRKLDTDDCRVHAWLQFGRAPIVRGNLILDLRFDTGLRSNFTAMPLDAPVTECPANITDWAPPRTDVLESP